MTDAVAALRAELGVPAGILDSLTPAEAETVLSLFVRARQVRAERLEAAIDDGLQVLPRLVRIPARKILFGK
ncbi:hypothetical protein ACWEVD_28635 [Nocardia thailandica]